MWQWVKFTVLYAFSAFVLVGLEEALYRTYVKASTTSGHELTSSAPTGEGADCARLPQYGSTSILNDPMGGRSTINGIYSVRNDLAQSVVAILGNSSLSELYQAVVVAPHSVTNVEVPTGHYGLGVMVGTTWCNLAKGFINGTRHSINGGVLIDAAVPGRTELSPGIDGRDYRVRFTRLSEWPTDTELAIKQSPIGYVTTAKVNGRDIPMVVDTGANMMSVPQWFAQSVGISCFRGQEFQTANGRGIGCVGAISELRMGQFVMNNVEVAVLPYLETGLVGMNVLRSFNVKIQDEQLQLTPIDAALQTSPSALRIVAETRLAPLVPWRVKEEQSSVTMRQWLQRDLNAVRWPLLIVQGLTLSMLLVFFSPLVTTNPSQHLPSKASAQDDSPVYNPKLYRRPRPIVNEESSSTMSELLRACWGDTSLMRRLMDFEISSSWGVNEEEAARRALQRLRRDRK